MRDSYVTIFDAVDGINTPAVLGSIAAQVSLRGAKVQLVDGPKKGGAEQLLVLVDSRNKQTVLATPFTTELHDWCDVLEQGAIHFTSLVLAGASSKHANFMSYEADMLSGLLAPDYRIFQGSLNLDGSLLQDVEAQLVGRDWTTVIVSKATGNKTVCSAFSASHKKEWGRELRPMSSFFNNEDDAIPRKIELMFGARSKGPSTKTRRRVPSFVKD